MRIYEELPCGCLVSREDQAMIPCCYPEVGQRPSKLHLRCMELFFKEGKSVEEIKQIVKERKV